ncbi:hypothetical protein BCV70DRAFT_145405, partial [Testicularia cyperi]
PGTSTSPSSNPEDSDISQRPTRSARSKAPASYREDLKAVLRADAMEEAAWLKLQQSKPPALHERRRTSARTKHEAEFTSARTALAQSELVPASDPDGFEVVETKVAPAKRAKGEAKEQTKALLKHPQLPSLEVKGTVSNASATPHPFFARKTRVMHGDPSTSAADLPASTSALFSAPKVTEVKIKKSLAAPWPTGTNTHVKGFRSEEAEIVQRLTSDLDGFRVRWHRPSQTESTAGRSQMPNDSCPADFVDRLNHARATEPSVQVNLAGYRAQSIEGVAACRADVLSFSSRSDKHSKGQLWSDAWRPLSASECLANEANAASLVEWLRRLLVAPAGTVQTTDKKRKQDVQRRVDRKKRRRRIDPDDEDEMADFIVGDDAEEEAWFDQFRKFDPKDDSEPEEAMAADAEVGSEGPRSEPEVSLLGLPGVSGSQKSSESGPFTVHLTNCMILCGSSGAGKTAAVYACASQLGYEVFELYPGIGKRSGKEMLSAVGDLGRNHMVSSGGSGGGANWRPKPSPDTDRVTGVRQSLILIEEADVLFDDDKGFWAAVIELVAESRRPVIITCNDLDLVPLHDLPVQEVLEFKKPTASQAIPYLQHVAANAGVGLDLNQIERSLRLLPGADSGSSSKCAAPRIDLRQAIHQLQFGSICQPAPVDVGLDQLVANAEAAMFSDIRTLARAADALSCADIMATASAAASIEQVGDYGVDRQTTRQMGSWRQIVPQPVAIPPRPALDSQMKLTLVEFAARFVGAENRIRCQNEQRAEPVSMQQARQLGALETMLDPLFVPPPLLMSNLVLDYAPAVRIMATADEDLFQLCEALRLRATEVQTDAPTPSGRSTRNSNRLT